MSEDSAANKLQTVREELMSFLHRQLENYQSRDDYNELFHLALLFLAGALADGQHILARGAYHRARWMTNLIFCVKIFHSQFRLTAHELDSLRKFITFIVTIYHNAWYTLMSDFCTSQQTNSAEAAGATCKTINESVANAELNSFTGQL